MNNPKILQVVQLPDEMKHQFIAANKDCTRNVVKTVIAGALVEDGRVLPLVYDGKYDFEVLDEKQLKRQRFFEGLVDRISEEVEKHKQNAEDECTAFFS